MGRSPHITVISVKIRLFICNSEMLIEYMETREFQSWQGPLDCAVRIHSYSIVSILKDRGKSVVCPRPDSSLVVKPGLKFRTDFRVFFPIRLNLLKYSIYFS